MGEKLYYLIVIEGSMGDGQGSVSTFEKEEFARAIETAKESILAFHDVTLVYGEEIEVKF